MTERIAEFRGEYRFLSNFYPSPIETVDELRWPTVEHYYQAKKAARQEDADKIRLASSPGEAKRLGRSILAVNDWDLIKVSIMRKAVLMKFCQNPDLRSMLMLTGEARLEEGNRWGDSFWGIDLKTGQGKNFLGKILMSVRNQLRENLEGRQS